MSDKLIVGDYYFNMGRDGLVGQRLTSVRFTIERGKIGELARALGDTDPLWWDDDAARAEGFDEAPLPPTALALVDHWRAEGALAHAMEIGADLDHLLHGEVEWEFVAQIRSGDQLVATTDVADVAVRQGARGGWMTLVTLLTTFASESGDVVARRRDVLIETQVAP